MEKREINPWKWQDDRNYVQAVEVKNPEATLYISGQTAINANGISSNEDMRTQLTKAIENLETVIREAGYEPKNIVRLNVYTTSHEEFFKEWDVLQGWTVKNGIKQAGTYLEVKYLFETLKVELEATVVR
ncbi:RidA family protein [Flavobacterium sp. NRK1]|uniref:RidA family protein n=1 Tax=Flavobacterium sp. NRK1 TaxID=2954929 RepID=UPI0020921F7B|nr:RidA family protein [Flavobacterium sp. NRK1]MCO6148668.1 RidA family protein [Flavobacterium sp. NRK1]